MHILKAVSIPLLAAALTSFKPGEPVATLTCKSESGRTTFKAVLPSCSYLEKAELSIDGSKLNFSFQDKSYIVFDADNKVLTVYLESNPDEPKTYKFIKFWAIPGSFKKIKGSNGPGTQFHDTYEFRAKFYATDPRRVSEPQTKTIELTCRLDYEL